MSSQPHVDNINAQLAGMFKANTTQATVTNGSFTYTEAEMRTLVQNWLDLAESYRQSQFNAENMTRIKPPAEDFASHTHCAAANQSGRAYQRYLEHNRDYCTQQAQLFQNALNDYLGIEHTNVAEMNKTAPHGPQAGV